jgi:hypothetical protein
MDIIPSIFETSDVGMFNRTNPNLSNDLMRVGEVVKVIYPEDPESVTSKFIEYNVMVQHSENGTAVTKIYNHCILINSLGSKADSSYHTLRPKDSLLKSPAETSAIKAGYGSKVLILCINGKSHDAIIIGGIRDDSDSDKGKKAKGHHLSWEFNGVHIDINDDGSFSLEKKGATKSDGTQDPKTPEVARQTKISVDSDGSFKVNTKDDKQTVIIDNKAGTITVKGDKRLTLNAKNIDIGQGADEFMLLGNTTVKTLGTILDEVSKIKVATSMGTSSHPLNVVKFKKIKSNLNKLLSKFIKVKKNP